MIRRALTSQLAADAERTLFEAFRQAFVLLAGLGVLAGLGHGPWVRDFALAVVLAAGLLSVGVGSVNVALYCARRAAWRRIH